MTLRNTPLLGCIAALLFITPVAASEAEVEHIDAILAEAVTGLQAVHDDTTAPIQCRIYTDALITTLALLDDTSERPDSVYVPDLLELMLAPLAAARNDCLLAI